jgi:hypothetical protein
MDYSLCRTINLILPTHYTRMDVETMGMDIETSDRTAPKQRFFHGSFNTIRFIRTQSTRPPSRNEVLTIWINFYYCRTVSLTPPAGTRVVIVSLEVFPVLPYWGPLS